ncbi:hypothetical protein GLYMA_12G153200v4 [Glycine max]|uniref:probable bifunctional methylthioribulose-1-phosphate dehydratase/enolase-phosphatase E1 n=1 Tax=Glycine soja TaxID=3848 RepID=UPI0010389C03|nr:probable bifunctional methylthioribulose-1-phosphate dehydratase/enolase-phosphatase E1 [Glycine soja]KAG4385719.1 hypothetical protein GLYMA_12G153200v4 [Glycine max]KAG4385720.1 hypothetical protein GLYMA_12G153200v4 [Glycine max]KAH1143320.1 hypothetical protein GYH30_033841 [Glycine max]KAH1143321.1 hypothetical protein GYH30_033841 [Glycine max]
MEMIKGIKGHGYYDELVVPIIENTAYEYELTEALAKAIEAYTKTTAVLVRNHGIYVWGDSWISAKTLVCVNCLSTRREWNHIKKSCLFELSAQKF